MPRPLEIITEHIFRNTKRAGILAHLVAAGGRATFAEAQIAIGELDPAAVTLHTNILQEAGFLVREKPTDSHFGTRGRRVTFAITARGRAAIERWRRAVVQSIPEKPPAQAKPHAAAPSGKSVADPAVRDEAT